MIEEINQKMKVQQHSYLLPVSENLVAILEKNVTQSGIETSNGVIINFRDKNSYLSIDGLLQVNITIHSDGKLQCITVFDESGYRRHREIENKLNFNFDSNSFRNDDEEYPLSQAIEVFTLWQRSFCSYYTMGVYHVNIASLI